MAKNKILPKRLDYLDVNDSACQFRINVDVLNEAFGFGESLFMKAGYPRNPKESIPGSKPGDRFRIWLPKLYGNKSGWHNILSDDGEHFYEKSDDSTAVDWMDVDDSIGELVNEIGRNLRQEASEDDEVTSTDCLNHKSGFIQ